MDDFQVFVKPVGASCNMDCSYCYYLEKQNLHSQDSVFRMSDELLEKYIIQHIAVSSGPAIFFSWHGGEPALAGLEFFHRIVEIQQRHLPENCRIINGIQTNGTLISHEWCRFFKKHNFIAGISIDGPERFHSINRKRKDGRSSFESVLNGYQLLNAYGVPTEILCVINSTNVHYPLEIYDFFKHLQAQFITFLPLVEQVSSDRRMVSERTVDAKAFGEFLCAVFDEWKSNDIGKIKIQVIEEALRTAFNLDHTLCIFKKTCGGVPVMEKNGDVYCCDHFVSEEYLMGNIQNSSLSLLLESPAQKAFGKAKYDTLPEYCLKCEVLNMCNGACPKDRFIHTPDRQPGLNYLCEGYKVFFNHCKPFIKQVAVALDTNE